MMTSSSWLLGLLKLKWKLLTSKLVNYTYDVNVFAKLRS